MKIAMTIFLLLSYISISEDVKHFSKFETAIDYARKHDHKLMVLFTGHTASNRKMEDVLLADSEIDSLFKWKKIDVVVLNADDKFVNNAELLEKIFQTKTWPVCGIINKDSILISEKCFLQKNLKEKISKIILSVE